ncbi:hypothetical protein BH23GEM9_BH23GEM9_06670 [soil metagenome]
MQLEPVNLIGLTAVILGCLMFLIPIAGLTARFAIKPITEALSKVSSGGQNRETVQMLERRMALLEQEVHGLTEMRADLARLLEDVDFQKQLRQPRG